MDVNTTVNWTRQANAAFANAVYGRTGRGHVETVYLDLQSDGRVNGKLGVAELRLVMDEVHKGRLEALVKRFEEVEGKISLFRLMYDGADFGPADFLLVTARRERENLSRIIERPATDLRHVFGRLKEAEETAERIAYEALEVELRRLRAERPTAMTKESFKVVLAEAKAVAAEHGYEQGRKKLIVLRDRFKQAGQSRARGSRMDAELEQAMRYEAPEKLGRAEVIVTDDDLRRSRAATCGRRFHGVVECDREIRDLGTARRPMELAEIWEPRKEKVREPELVRLALVMGQNPKTGKLQWEGRNEEGNLFVLDESSPEPSDEALELGYEVVRAVGTITFVRLLK